MDSIPPVLLSFQLLLKIEEERVQLILNTPDWLKRTLYTGILILLVDELWPLQNRPGLLDQGTLFYFAYQSLALTAWL